MLRKASALTSFCFIIGIGAVRVNLHERRAASKQVSGAPIADGDALPLSLHGAGKESQSRDSEDSEDVSNEQSDDTGVMAGMVFHEPDAAVDTQDNSRRQTQDNCRRRRAWDKLQDAPRGRKMTKRKGKEPLAPTDWKRRLWTPQEDEILKGAVEEHGSDNWRAIGIAGWEAIAVHIPDRSDKACLCRWRQHLRPGAHKDKWTFEEEEHILERVAEMGTHWDSIRRYFMPGRSADEIQKKWEELVSTEGAPSTDDRQKATRKPCNKDVELKCLVGEHGGRHLKAQDWEEIAEQLGNTSARQCRDKWNSIKFK